MKSIKYLLLVIFALAITVSSCKKDDLTPKEMLMGKAWKYSTEKYNGVLQTMDNCQKDDVLTFKADGTYTYNVGITTCYSGETSYTGTWVLSADGKSLTVDGDAATVVISENKVVVTVNDGGDITEMTFIPA
jgi:hypothetical protein